MEEIQQTESSEMNSGLPTTVLADPDCTETGGNDGYATPTFSAAMQNSVISKMPETLEAQLNLFKHEDKHVSDNSMFPSPSEEAQLKVPLPLYPEQPPQLPPVNFGTEIYDVSTDQDGVMIDRIAHRMAKH